jgi:hypothetical protein
MSPRTLVPLCVALGTTAGCSGSEPLVDYGTAGGLAGNGNGTSLHVTSDGMATRTSRTGGTQTVQLDATTFADLKQTIAAAQFPGLQPTYGCLSCADAYVYEVTVQVDGNTYATRTDGLENAASPESLKTLLLTLDQIANPPR